MIKGRLDMKDNKGFSLVELIVVIANMAILAAVAIPVFSSYIVKAKEATDIKYMHDIEYAIRLAHGDKPEDKIKTFTVYINPENGYVEDIVYTVEKDFYATEDYSHKDGAGGNASPIISWEYYFKAWKTVTNHPNWKDEWKLEERIPPDDDEIQLAPEDMH